MASQEWLELFEMEPEPAGPESVSEEWSALFPESVDRYKGVRPQTGPGAADFSALKVPQIPDPGLGGLGATPSEFEGFGEQPLSAASAEEMLESGRKGASTAMAGVHEAFAGAEENYANLLDIAQRIATAEVPAVAELIQAPEEPEDDAGEITALEAIRRKVKAAFNDGGMSAAIAERRRIAERFRPAWETDPLLAGVTPNTNPLSRALREAAGKQRELGAEKTYGDPTSFGVSTLKMMAGAPISLGHLMTYANPLGTIPGFAAHAGVSAYDPRQRDLVSRPMIESAKMGGTMGALLKGLHGRPVSEQAIGFGAGEAALSSPTLSGHDITPGERGASTAHMTALPLAIRGSQLARRRIAPNPEGFALSLVLRHPRTYRKKLEEHFGKERGGKIASGFERGIEARDAELRRKTEDAKAVAGEMPDGELAYGGLLPSKPRFDAAVKAAEAKGAPPEVRAPLQEIRDFQRLLKALPADQVQNGQRLQALIYTRQTALVAAAEAAAKAKVAPPPKAPEPKPEPKVREVDGDLVDTSTGEVVGKAEPAPKAKTEKDMLLQELKSLGLSERWLAKPRTIADLEKAVVDAKEHHAEVARRRQRLKEAEEAPPPTPEEQIAELRERADAIEAGIPREKYRKDGQLRKNAGDQWTQRLAQAEQLRARARELEGEAAETTADRALGPQVADTTSRVQGEKVKRTEGVNREKLREELEGEKEALQAQLGIALSKADLRAVRKRIYEIDDRLHSGSDIDRPGPSEFARIERERRAEPPLEVEPNTSRPKPSMTQGEFIKEAVRNGIPMEEAGRRYKQILSEMEAETANESPDTFTKEAQIRTGKPVRISGLWRGEGRDWDIYAEGAEGPILGPGRYGALSERDAKRYGDTARELEPVTLRNPYVISGDNQLRALLGGDIPYDNAARMPLLRAAREKLERDGHDGVVVVVEQRADVSPTGQNVKRLREFFGHSQVIEFKAEAPKPAAKAEEKGFTLDSEAEAKQQRTPEQANLIAPKMGDAQDGRVRRQKIENEARGIRDDSGELFDQVPAGERVPDAPPTTEKTGRRGVVLTRDGEEPVRYAAIELDEVVPSHNPLRDYQPRADYAKGGQQRNYTEADRADAELKASTWDGRHIYDETSSPISGPPIVTPHARVVGGNKRTMVQQLIYEGRGSITPEQMRAEVIENAGRFGIVPESLAGMKRPGIFRIMDRMPTEAEFKPITALMNEAVGQKAVTPTEMGVTNADRLSDNTLTVFSRGIDAARSDIPTVREAFRNDPAIVEALERDGVITPENRQTYVSKAGRLNDPGLALLENAVLGRVVQDAATIDAMPPGLKKRIARSAPAIIRADAADPAQGIRGLVQGAIKSELHRAAQGLTVDELVGQIDMLGDGVPAQSNPAIADIMRTMQKGDVATTTAFERFSQILKSMQGTEAEVKAAFERFAKEFGEATSGQESLFGEKPTAADAFRIAFGIKPQKKAPKTEAMAVPDTVLPPDRGRNYLPTMQQRQDHDAAPPTHRPPLDSVVYADAVLRKLGDDMGVAMAQGRMKGQVWLKKGQKLRDIRGLARNGALRLRDWHQLDVAAHEIGHIVATRYKQIGESIRRNPALEQQLLRMSYDKALVNEGWAEFMRAYLSEPGYAQKYVPDGVELMAKLRQADPKLDRAMANAQRGMTDWYQQDALTRARAKEGAMVPPIKDVPLRVAETGPMGPVSEKVREHFDRFRQAFVDTAHYLRESELALKGEMPDASESAYDTFWLASKKGGTLLGAFRHGAPRWSADGAFKYDPITWYERTADGKLLERKGGPVDFFWEFQKKGEFEDFMSYMKGTRAQELAAEGREHLFPKDEYEALIKRGMQEDGETPKLGFKENAQAYQDWNRGILKFGADSGVLSYGALEYLSDKFYFPFLREAGPYKHLAEYGKTVIGDRKAIIRLKGGTRNLRPSMDAIVDSANRILSLAIDNNVRRHIARFSEWENGHSLVQPIARDDIRRDNLDAESIKKSYLERLYEGHWRAKAAELWDIEGITEKQVQSRLNEWWADAQPRLKAEAEVAWKYIEGPMQGIQRGVTPTSREGEVIMTVLEGGEPSHFYRVVAPGLARSILAMNPKPLHPNFVKTVGAARRFLQTVATRNPGFYAVNPFRDQLQASIVGRGEGYTPRGFGRGFREFWERGEAYRDAEAQGGSMASILGEKDLMTELGREGRMRGRIVDNPRKLLDMWIRLGDGLELATRINMKQRALEAGMTEAESTRLFTEISTDFSRHGDNLVLRWFNEGVPFLRSGIAGLDRELRALTHGGNRKNNQKAVALAAASFASFASGLAVLNAGNPHYERMGADQRAGYFHGWIPDLDTLQQGMEGTFDKYELFERMNSDDLATVEAAEAEFERRYTHFQIPKGWGFGAFATVAEHGTDLVMRNMLGGEPAYGKKGKQVAQVLLKQFYLGYMPQLVKAPYESGLPIGNLTGVTNWNAFQERPVTSEAQKQVIPALRQSRSHALDKMGLATATLPPEMQLSPVVAEHWGNIWLGDFFRTGLQMADEILAGEAGDRLLEQLPFVGEGPDQQLSLNPTRRFVPDRQPRSDTTTEFYDDAARIEMLSSSVKQAVKVWGVAEAKRIAAAHPDWQMGPAVASTRMAVGKMRTQAKHLRSLRGADITEMTDAYVKQTGDPALHTAYSKASTPGKRKKLVLHHMDRRMKFYMRQVQRSVKKGKQAIEAERGQQ